ncbi:MAG: Asp-tRNA(Asn)/Glu-tRNA(Gln) amidotransferase subunit GatC [Clostridiaceae bacterium]
MSVSKKDVEHIAELARLKFTDEGMESLANDLNNILVYVEELQKVNTDEAKITVNPVYIENRFREDVVVEGFDSEKSLMNAPGRIEDYFLVPSVFEVEE